MNTRPVVVRGVEAEPENVVVLDVEDSGGDLEQDPADQQQQRQPFRSWAIDRSGGQANSRDDRPQFGSTKGMISDPPDMHTLKESVSHEVDSANRRWAASAIRRLRDRLAELPDRGDYRQPARSGSPRATRSAVPSEYRGQPGPP